jgi:methionyl-tRNA synthetase
MAATRREGIGSVRAVSRFYVTTPIYYVTAEPHLGHAYTTIVGDALTRWHRLLGDDVKYVTGTDEHGLKVQRAAEDAGEDPRSFVDRIAPKYAEAWKGLDIAHDDFIRTTEPRHRRAVLELLQRCYDAGDIELDLYRGKYCARCEEYYTDDELLPGDLCPIHKLPVDEVEEENYFFRLSRFGDRLLDWYAAHPNAIVPEFRGNEALGLIRSGLRDFSVSRTSLTWGITLPWDERHVAYVWFDALTNYLAAVGYGSDPEQFARWWPVDYHLIGKDIVRQHCVYWPAMLLSAGLELPRGWAVGGWILSAGEKMSKTTGNVVKPLDLVDQVGVDGFRYFVLADTPYGHDGDFTYEGVIGRYNADLANNLGNLTSRVATVVTSKCAGAGPAPSADSPLAEAAATAVDAARAAWDAVAPSRALEATWRLIRETNAHLESREPWKMAPGPDVEAVLGDALEALRIVTILASPALPSTTQAIWDRIGLPGAVTDQRVPSDVEWGGYPAGSPVTKGPPLFPRISS